MNYKQKKPQSEGLFPFFEMKSEDYFQRSYDFQEWRNQISNVIDNFHHQNYDIYQIYEYISSCTSEIPYQLLIDSHLLTNLLNHFNQLVFNLCGNQNVQDIILIPEKRMEIVDPYFILCIKLLIFLKADFLIQNSVFNNDFFISLSKMCFNRNKYCLITQEVPVKCYSICVESLKLVKLIFESSQEALLYFEDNFDFSYYTNQQFIMAQVFDIKYHSYSVLLPWIPIYPGNKQVFDLFYNEMVKTIKKENDYIFKSQTAEKHYKNDADSNYDKEIIKQDNKFNLISLLLYGILKFIQYRPILQVKQKEEEIEEEEEEEESHESLFVTMDYAYSKGVIEIASFAIKSNHVPTVLYGFEIVNCYLREKRLTEKDIVLFLTDIRGDIDKLPVLLNYSKKICREETKMLEFLLEVMPEDEFESFFEPPFVSALLNTLNDKCFKWKLYSYEFVAFLLIYMNFNFIEKMLSDVEIVEFLSDVRNSKDDVIIDLIFDGIYRIMQNSPELKELLIDKGIEEEIILYIEDSEYADKAQAILELIQS